MGVAGLWQLLDPTGKPIRLETLEGKVLAIDVSIWLNQLVKGFRGPGGDVSENAHLIGLFQRLCKLLHFRIKPVFVFDGEAPALKYNTLATRKKRRNDSDETIRKATQRLLRNYMNQKLLGDANPKLPKLKPSRRQQAEEALFRLPQVVLPSADDSGDESSTSDLENGMTSATDFCSIKIESDEFGALPAELQHEYLVALKENEKRSTVDADGLPLDGNDFSTYQMQKVLKRSDLQARIEKVQKEMGDGLLRMASDANVKVLLQVSPVKPSLPTKQDTSDGLDESPLKKAKTDTESTNEFSSCLDTREKRVESFLVSQWLEGAQRGDESNETLKKAVELVREEVELVSDSGASSDNEEVVINQDATFLCGSDTQLLSKTTDSNATRAEAMKPDSSCIYDNRNPSSSSKDSVISDGPSLEVLQGSVAATGTVTNIQRSKQNACDTLEEISMKLRESDAQVSDGTQLKIMCNTDILSADLEVSETGNSVFQLDDAAAESFAGCAQNGNLHHLTNPEKTKELVSLKELGSSTALSKSVVVGSGMPLTHDDIFEVPANKRSYDPNKARITHNEISANEQISTIIADENVEHKQKGNPTDFHEALEIIRKQERQKSIRDGMATTSDNAEAASQNHAYSLTCLEPTQAACITNKNNDIIEQPKKQESGIIEKTVCTSDCSHSIANRGSSDIAHTAEGVLSAVNKSPPESGRFLQVDNLVVSDQNETVEKLHEVKAGQDCNASLVQQTNCISNPMICWSATSQTLLQSPDISEHKKKLEVQSQALQNEIDRIQRQSSEVTKLMTEDCEELLRMFGVPCVKAPREAEAQCAALEGAGLVQGVVTDDSDIFLFGGQTVYKNFFGQNAQCELFSSKTIAARLKLCREDLIGFAMLTGSDYTSGIEHVGPVTACEILAEFSGGEDKDVFKGLIDFKEWWHMAQKGSALPKNSVRARFAKLQLDDKFPNDLVFDAYSKPTVAHITDKFSWSRPDLDSLRSFATKRFNWSQERTDSYLLPILKKYEDRSAQPRIDSFLTPALQKRENLFPSKRLKAAVSKIKPIVQREAKLSESSSESE